MTCKDGPSGGVWQSFRGEHPEAEKSSHVFIYLFIYFMVLRKAPNDAHKNRLIKNSLTDNLNLNIESIPYISQIDLIYLHSFS